MYHTMLKGVVMGFSNNFLGRNHKQQEEGHDTSSTKAHKYEQKDEEFKVIIKTDRELSEEEQKSVFSIMKDGLYVVNQHPADICFSVMLELNIMNPLVYNRPSFECVEISF